MLFLKLGADLAQTEPKVDVGRLDRPFGAGMPVIGNHLVTRLILDGVPVRRCAYPPLPSQTFRSILDDPILNRDLEEEIVRRDQRHRRAFTKG